jgi:hypothetical protein
MLNGLSKLAKRKTGYTHQWNKPEYKDYSKFLMASTHNVFEANIAKDYGFRTFNIGNIENINGFYPENRGAYIFLQIDFKQ